MQRVKWRMTPSRGYVNYAPGKPSPIAAEPQEHMAVARMGDAYQVNSRLRTQHACIERCLRTLRPEIVRPD